MAFGDLLNDPSVDNVVGQWNTGPHTITFAATPTSGNLLVVEYRARGTHTTPSGWSVAGSSLHDALWRTTLYYKISDGTETSVSLNTSDSQGYWASYFEFDKGTEGFDVSPLDDFVEETVTPDTLGTLNVGSVTTTTDNAIVMFAASHISSAAMTNSVDSGFTIDVNNFGNGSHGASFFGHKVLSATATESPTITWGINVESTGVLAAFRSVNHKKPAGITGLNTGHPLNANINKFYEFGQLDKELVSDTAITTTATTVSDADLGSCKLFDATADALSETLTAIEESTVLVVYKGAGTRNDGDNSLFRVVDYNSDGTKYQLWYDGYSGGSWEILYDGGYGTDRRFNTTAFTTDGQYATGNTVAVTTSRTGTMKFAANGSVDTSDTQTTAVLAGPPELALLSEVGSAGSMYVAAVVYFDKVLNDTELQSVTSDPWAMLDSAGDSTAPVFSVAPAVTVTAEDGHTISSTIDEDGTIYGIRMTNGATAPADGDEVITWHDAGVSGDVLEVRSVSASSGVSADLVFNTGTVSTAYDYYIVAADDEGTPNVQASATLVEATTSTPQFSVDSITSGTIRAGDSVTVGLSNANATGKTLTIAGQAITPDSQTDSQIVFTAPDPKTFGDQTLSYNTALTVEVTDGGDSDTTSFQIAPDVGDYYDTLTATTGIYANDTGVEVGDNAYATVVSGTPIVVDLTVGAAAFTGGNGTLRYWLQDQGTGVWSGSADEIYSTEPNSPATGAPVITGTPTQGQTLTADTSSIADTDGLGAFSYEWRRDDVAISGATSSTYTLTQTDVGSTIKVNVSFTDGAGGSESLTSSGVGPVANVNDAPTGDVTIDNTVPEVGDTLTASNTIADVDGLGSITYQWRRSGSNISGATGTTYAVVEDDALSTISVVASYTDGQGTQESVASSETTAVPLPPDTEPPVITILGSNPRVVSQDSVYNDQGARAYDERDGDISGDIVPTSNVNTAVLGSYTVTYNVSDAAGNAATPAVRDVEVVEFATTPDASNEQAIAFYRAETGIDSYNMNELAIAYYKQVTGSVLNSFGDLLPGAQEGSSFQGYSPADYRNF